MMMLGLVRGGFKPQVGGREREIVGSDGGGRRRSWWQLSWEGRGVGYSGGRDAVSP